VLLQAGVLTAALPVEISTGTRPHDRRRRRSGLFVAERGQGQPFAYLCGETVELWSAAVGRVFLGR
jgi:hypothetical protein